MQFVVLDPIRAPTPTHVSFFGPALVGSHSLTFSVFWTDPSDSCCCYGSPWPTPTITAAILLSLDFLAPAHVLHALWGGTAQLHRDANRTAADKAGPRLLLAPTSRRDLRPHRGADSIRRQVRAASQWATHIPQGRLLIAADPIQYQQHYAMGSWRAGAEPHRHCFCKYFGMPQINFATIFFSNH